MYTIVLLLILVRSFGEGLGGSSIYCTEDADCAKHAFCYGVEGSKLLRTCRCNENFVRSPTPRNCVRQLKSYTDTCSYEAQCRAILHDSFCNSSSMCQCFEGFILDSDFCNKVTKIGERCRSEYDCYFENGRGFCENNRCTCPNNTKPSRNKKTCQEIKGLGDQCNTDQECTKIDNLMCNVVCRCDDKSVISRNGSLCLAVATELNTSCIEDGQCQKHFPKSTCENNTCMEIDRDNNEGKGIEKYQPSSYPSYFKNRDCLIIIGVVLSLTAYYLNNKFNRIFIN